MSLKHSAAGGLFSRSLKTAAKHINLHGLRYSMASFLREIWFDLSHGVDTTTLHGSMDHPHSVHYQGADPQLVKQLLSSLPTRARASTFVDFGCGKGRALLLALEHGFQEVIGVEIAPDLAAICRRNLAKSTRAHRFANARVIESDATTFAPPSGAVSAFFFNPFHGPPLEQVAANIASASQHSGAEAWLIYVNPLHLEPFLARGFKLVHSLMHRQTLLAVIAHLQPGATHE